MMSRWPRRKRYCWGREISLAAATAIRLLTPDMASDAIGPSKLAAYAMGSSLLIGVLLLLVIGFKYIPYPCKYNEWDHT